MLRRLPLLLLCVVVLFMGPPTAAQADTATQLPFTDGPVWLAVDPSGQHVFVSNGPGTSSIVVLDFDGNIVKTITGESGASGMVVDTATHTLYAALHDASAISEIDTQTLSETERFSTAPYSDPVSVVIAGGKVWFSCNQSDGRGCIVSANLDGTGQTAPISGFYFATVLAAGGSANHLLAIGETYESPPTVAIYDVSGGTPSLVSSARLNTAEVRSMTFDPSGANLLLASGWPYYVMSLSTTDLLPSAEYPIGAYPQAVAVTADGAYVAAGRNFIEGPDIAIYPAGDTTPRRTWTLETDLNEPANNLAFSPDASRLFAVTSSGEHYYFNVLYHNDDFTSAIVLDGEDVTRIGDTNVDAGLEAGEPTQVAGAPAGASVWYRWIAPATGRVSIDTCFSDFDTLLAVYTGGAVGSLSEVASNDDAGADYMSSTVGFQATAGTTYQIRVDGFQGDTGTFNLHLLETDGSAPSNDSFASAVQLGGLSAVRTGDTNVGASLETGEPAVVDGAPAGRSIWYRWAAPASGILSLDTAGSSFDTLLGVYTGSTVGGLSEVAVNDDAASVPTSALLTDVVGGTTYWIRVDGYAGETGTVNLHLTETTAPGAPTNVSASPGPEQATVSWNAPAFDGGSPIIGYELTAYAGGVEEGFADIPVEDGTTVTIIGLTNGTTYTFRIAAVNDIGVGPQSAASNPVTPANPPPAPLAPTNSALAPTNSAVPTITGTPKPGQTLSANPGSWKGTTPITYTYQWASCDRTGAGCVAVPGETTSSYRVSTSDAGSTLRVVVTASNVAGHAAATSAQTAMVPKPLARCTVPKLKGKTVAKARTLLRQRHCRLGRVSRAHSQMRRGHIVSQRPRAGASRTQGTKVRILVSLGPKR